MSALVKYSVRLTVIVTIPRLNKDSLEIENIPEIQSGYNNFFFEGRTYSF